MNVVKKDNETSNVEILNDAKGYLVGEPSLYSLEWLFDHYNNVPPQYKKRIIAFFTEASTIKEGLIGKRAMIYLKAIVPKNKESSKIIIKHEKTKKVLYRTRFTYEGWNYAEFIDNGVPKFLKYNGNKEEEITELSIPDPDDPECEITISPVPQIAQTPNDRVLHEEKSEAVKFPYRPIEYKSDYDLYLEIKAFIHAFCELRHEDEIILSLYVMKAAIFDVIKDMSFPFVHILAPYGKGKSRLLIALSEMTPYGFYCIDIKSAALKRVSELYGAVLFVDEKSEIDEDLAAIINAKYNANSMVLNANNEIQQGIYSIIGYYIFGPVVIASRSPFGDAIESKSFQVDLDFELNREDLPRKLKGPILEEFRLRARGIRAKLLRFRTKWHESINKIGLSGFLEPYKNHTEPRLFEIISFFEDFLEVIPEIKTEIVDVLSVQILRNVEVAKTTPDGIVADAVLSRIESEENQIDYSINGECHKGIFLRALYEDFGENQKQNLGRKLSALGLRTERPTVEMKEGTDLSIKRKVSVIRIPDDKKLKELRLRYDPYYMKSVLDGITQTLHQILDDQDEKD